MTRILIGGVVGGIVWFAWGFISWMVLPWHTEVLRPPADEAALVAGLRQGLPETGAYYFPAIADDANMWDGDDERATAFHARHREGPLGMVFYRAEGTEPMSPVLFVRAIAIDVVIGLLLAGVLASVAGGYGARVGVGFCVGVVAVLATHMQTWNWMYAPTDYTLTVAADVVAASLLASLAVAAIVRRRPRGAAETD